MKGQSPANLISHVATFILCVSVNVRHYVSGSSVLVGGSSNNNNNLALGKPTKQSSTYSIYGAYLAVDGWKETQFSWGSCSQTGDSSLYAWWQVDLLKDYVITALEITSRDGETDKLSGFAVEVSSDKPSKIPGFPGFTTSSSLASVCVRRRDDDDDEAVPCASTFSFRCERPVRGRYVRIVKRGYDDSQNWTPLSLCEVEVYGPREWRLEKRELADGTMPEVLETVVTGTGTGSLRSPVECARLCVERAGYPCLYIQVHRVDGRCRLVKSIKNDGGGSSGLSSLGWDFYAVVRDDVTYNIQVVETAYEESEPLVLALH